MRWLSAQVRRVAAAVAPARSPLGEQAFFDADAAIVLLASESHLPPSVLVDHEITHATLLRNTGLGLLEQIAAFARWLVRESIDAESDALEQAADELLTSVRRITEPVHEAVAWLGTEIQSRGREDFVAPRPYRRDVARLTRVMGALSDGVPNPTQVESHLNIAEAIGVHALSPPALREFFTVGLAAAARPDRELARRLSSASENPMTRFHQLCDAIRDERYEDVQAWSRFVFSAAKQAEPKETGGEAVRRRVAHVPLVHRVELQPHADRLVAARIPWLPRAPVLERDDLEGSWKWFRAIVSFAWDLDRYSQTCVLPPVRPSSRRVEFFEGDNPPPPLASADEVVVSLGRADTYPYGWSKPRREGLVTLATPRDGNAGWAVWIAAEATAQRYLKGRMHAGAAIVVNGASYDYDAGDLAGGPFLGDIPHVVMRLTDFRSFWCERAVWRLGGLAGSTEIQWKPLPFQTFDSYYGFIVLRDAERDWPVVLIPTVIGKAERVVSVADAVKSPWGAHLVHVESNAYSWLDTMTAMTLVAARRFEACCR